MASIAATTVVLGCYTAPRPTPLPFEESEYAPYAGRGTSTIEGQAFLRTRAGDIKYAAGSEVDLTPVTKYSTAWWYQEVVGGKPVHPDAKDYRAGMYNKHTRADSEGRFTFDGLRPGEYFISTKLTWEYLDPMGLPPGGSGAMLGARVRVDDAQRTKVVLESVRPVEW